MKKLIVFDLDGTLAESKAPLDAKMALLLTALLGIVKAAGISAGNWPQFDCPVTLEGLASEHLGLFNSHHRLATPVSPWEWLKIGGGTPPTLSRHGWLVIYHGPKTGGQG